MKNIFISYSHKDEQWKDKVVSHLKILERNGLCKIWHDRDISLGEQWYPEIDAALNQADVAIMLISNDFLDSVFINKEEIPRLIERREKHRIVLIPLFLRFCAWQEEKWLSGLQGYPFDGCFVVEQDGVEVDVDKKLAEFAKIIARLLKENKPDISFAGNSPVTKTRATILLTSLPSRKIDLIGREEELRLLEQRLQDSGPVLLVQGLGGIGKTEVCKRFFLDHYRHYAFAGWIDCVASIKESVVNACSVCPEPMNLADTDTLEERFRKITGFLRQLPGDALLVFDNIDNPADEHLDLLTSLPCNVLANSRSLLPGFRHYALEFLSEASCMELFYKHYDLDRDEAAVKNIVALCGRHTLTVELLARTARNAAMNAHDLLDLLVQKGFNLDDDIHDKVHTAWHDKKQRETIFNHLLTVFDLSGVTAEELDILVNAAVLPPVDIPVRDIKEWLRLGDNEAVNALAEKGWLRLEKGNIFMHPVVAEVCRYKKKPGVKSCEHLIESLTGILDVKPAENPLAKKGWVIFADTVLRHIDEKDKKVACLANNLSYIYWQLGLLAKALEFQLKDIEILEKILDNRHPDLATSYNNVSTIYKDLGQLAKALEFQLKALKIREEVLDKNHPDLATSYNNVALIYNALGQLAKALEFQLKAVSIYEKVLDSYHPLVATSYNNVSLIYKALGQWAKALEFQEKALKIREEVLDKNHPDLASSYNNVSLIYKALGQWEKALEFQLKDIEISEKILDINHPDLATSYNNVSTLYWSMGQWEQALAYAEKAVAILQHLFPSGHPNLTVMQKNLEKIKQAGKDGVR